MMRKTVQISVSFKQFSDDDQQNFVTSLSNVAGKSFWKVKSLSILIDKSLGLTREADSRTFAGVKSEEVKIVSVKTIGSGRRVDEGIEAVAEIETSVSGQVQSSVLTNLEQASNFN